MPWARYNSGLGGHRVALDDFAEEGSHFPSGQKRDQNPATCLTDKGPDMGNLAWRQQRVPRVEVETLRSHLELELTFEDTGGEFDF